MKKLADKKLISVLALLASVGVVYANEGTFKATITTAEKAIIVRELIKAEIIVPISGYTDWYQINHARLVDLQMYECLDSVPVNKMIENLKAVVGDVVKIKEVDVFHIPLGSQDDLIF